ncbi:hypothetical protein EBZ37_04590, partial [bacterium]|nr:hypothetical protein [bacterium]
MIAAIFHGFFASLIVSVALAMSATARGANSSSFWALVVLAVLIFSTAFVQRQQEKKASDVDLERYDGGADLLVHIHAPGLPDRSSRWTLRGLLSWILSGMGFAFGPEGVASELSQSARMMARDTSTRWSDQRRRTDAALALAAGMSAGFGAPFAAVLLPAELSVGGHVLTSVLAAVSGFVGIQFFTDFFGQYGLSVLGVRGRLSHLWGFRFHELNDWISAIIVCLVCTFGALLTLWVIRQGRVLIDRWGAKRASFASVVAGVLLLSVLILSPQSMGSLPIFFERVIRNELPIGSLIALALSLFLTVCAIYTGLGSMGVWWPSFLLGATVSMISGYIGMMVAVYSNVRTTVNAQRKGFEPCFNTAFQAGSVMGFALNALGLFVLYILMCFYSYQYKQGNWDILMECISGYGLGGSTVAMFGRVGGGIYTKAADVGADLCGKV